MNYKDQIIRHLKKFKNINSIEIDSHAVLRAKEKY